MNALAGFSNSNANILKRLWLFLWSACFFLLLFFYKLADGQRMSFPGGQYVFFVIVIAASAMLLFKIHTNLTELVSRQFVTMMLFLVTVLACAAIFGLQPFSGVRLLLIIGVTSLPFVLLGASVRLMHYQQATFPVFAVPVFCTVMATVLQITGPFSVSGLIIDNHIFDANLDRWSFWFNEANNFAWVLATGITALLYHLSVSHSKLRSFMLAAILLPLSLYLFWKTNSRGVSVWVVFSLLMYICLLLSRFIHKEQLKFLLLGTISLCVIITGLVYVNFDDISRFLRLDQGDLTTGRMQIWRLILAEVKNYPVLGYGINATELIVDAADLKQEGPWPVLKGPLNLFIGILGEAGILGFIALMWLMGGALWQCVKIIYRHFDVKDEVFYFAFFLVTMILGMAIQQNGEWQVLRVTPFNFLFFFLVTAAWSLEKNLD